MKKMFYIILTAILNCLILEAMFESKAPNENTIVSLRSLKKESRMSSLTRLRNYRHTSRPDALLQDQEHELCRNHNTVNFCGFVWLLKHTQGNPVDVIKNIKHTQTSYENSLDKSDQLDKKYQKNNSDALLQKAKYQLKKYHEDIYSGLMAVLVQQELSTFPRNKERLATIRAHADNHKLYELSTICTIISNTGPSDSGQVESQLNTKYIMPLCILLKDNNINSSASLMEKFNKIDEEQALSEEF